MTTPTDKKETDRFESTEDDLNTTPANKDEAAGEKELDQVLKNLGEDVSPSKDKPMNTQAKLEALAKQRKMGPVETKKVKSGEDRNATPPHKGGRKDVSHPKGVKEKLLKEIHQHKDIQKMLEKHPTLDIIIVDKAKANK